MSFIVVPPASTVLPFLGGIAAHARFWPAEIFALVSGDLGLWSSAGGKSVLVSSISGRRIHEAPYGVRPAKPTPPTSRFSAYIGAMSRTGCFQPGYIMSQRWIFRPIFGNTLAGSKSICTFAIVIGKMTVSKIKQASTLNRCLFVLKE